MNHSKKLRIGIVFNFRKGWHGGIIYIINVINALNFLDEADKPDVFVFYNTSLKEYLADMKYPHITFVEWRFPDFYKGYLTTWLTRKNVFADDIIQQYNLNGIYPINDRPVAGNIKKNVRIIAWLPDVQHKFYPHFFGKKRTFLRNWRFKLILKNTNDLVVSSDDVKSHFYTFYRIKKDLRIHTLKFVSIIDNFSFPSMEVLSARYKVPHQYYIVSNSFTNHKNHVVILKALILLKKSNIGIHIVFTGKMEFKGNEAYIKKIRQIVAENKLEKHVSFLGVIPRHDQLGLMKNAVAVIQPSLFEGWSTVIEDAKSLQVPVIASDLPVNIEQLGNTGVFFKREDEYELADILKNFSPDIAQPIYQDYTERVKIFAGKVLQIFKSE